MSRWQTHRPRRDAASSSLVILPLYASRSGRRRITPISASTTAPPSARKPGTGRTSTTWATAPPPFATRPCSCRSFARSRSSRRRRRGSPGTSIQFAAFALGFAALARAIGRLKLGRATYARARRALGARDRGRVRSFTCCASAWTASRSARSRASCSWASRSRLAAWMLARPAAAGLGLLIPTVLKIGPGFGYLLLLFSRPRDPPARDHGNGARRSRAPSSLTLWFVGGWARFAELMARLVADRARRLGLLRRLPLRQPVAQELPPALGALRLADR